MDDLKLSSVSRLLGIPSNELPTREIPLPVLNLQVKLSIRFPDDLILLWTHTKDSAVICCEGAAAAADEAFMLHSLSPIKDSYTESQYLIEIVEKRWDTTQRHFSLAKNACGDQLVLDFSLNADPPILFYRPRSNESPYTPMARNFSELLLRTIDKNVPSISEEEADKLYKVEY